MLLAPLFLSTAIRLHLEAIHIGRVDFIYLYIECECCLSIAKTYIVDCE